MGVGVLPHSRQTLRDICLLFTVHPPSHFNTSYNSLASPAPPAHPPQHLPSVLTSVPGCDLSIDTPGSAFLLVSSPRPCLSFLTSFFLL